MPEERRKIYTEALEGIPYKNEDQEFLVNGFDEPQHYNWEVIPWSISKEKEVVLLFLLKILPIL